MDNISFYNSSLFDSSMRLDLQTLKLAEMIHEFFSLKISTFEQNYERKDKDLMDIMDSMNMLSDEVENIRKNNISAYSTIEEMEVKTNGRSNSSARINIEIQNTSNEKQTPASKNNIQEISTNLKTTKASFISRSPERKSNKFVFSGSPKNEKSDKKESATVTKTKTSDRPIQEIIINNPQTRPIIMGKNQENNKKMAIERRASPNQVKGSIGFSNFHSNNTTKNTSINNINKQVPKSKIEVIVMGNPTRTGNSSPVNNQSKNKAQENQFKEKGSKFKAENGSKKISTHGMKSRSPQQKDMNFTKLTGSSPTRKSFEDQNNDTSVNSNEKYLRHERKNIMSNCELSAKRKNSNHSNSCSNNEVTKSMNAGNSSLLSAYNDANNNSTFMADKFKKFFNNEDNYNIMIKLFNFCRVKEKVALKNISHLMRNRFFESEILRIHERIAYKRPEENPFFFFTLRKDLEVLINTESLYLSDYVDDESILNSLTLFNVVNMIYIILYNERNDVISIVEKIEKIEDYILQIDFDRNIYSKISIMIKNLKNSIDIFHILRGLFDMNQDNFLFMSDLPKKFDSLVKFAACVAMVVEQGQNIEVVLDIEILNHKIDILRAYSDKQFDQ